MKRNLRILGLLLGLILAACTPQADREQPLRGRILLWHMWNEPDTAVLNRLLDRFHEAYPGLKVISVAYTPEELRHQFAITVERGLGPDLLIASHLWTPELADNELIVPLNEQEHDLSSFSPDALETLRYKDKLYGLPLALQTSALYYNRELTDKPPTTLDGLMEQAAEGKGVAINTNFDAAFWGVQAFGGRLLDEEGRIVLNQGGFANWLDWLREANNAPNFILNNDEEVLSNLFINGKVAYYVGRSSELSALRQALGEETVGVAPLPAGPNDAAGPFLSTEAFFFSTASSPAQEERAMLLVQFLTNAEQQRKLAQEAGRIPANSQVRIDRRIAPEVASFVDQSKTAIPLRLVPQIFETINLGRDTYVQVLEGLTGAADAALALTERVNESQGLGTVAVATSVACKAVGALEVWHSWPDWRSAALEQVAVAYTQLCPGLSIHFQAFSPDELFAQYRQAVQEGSGPDLLLITSDQTMRLASAGLIRDISEGVSPTFLQRYIPEAPNTVRFENRLFGLPIALDSYALYYNAYLVTEPPADLGDLLAQIGPERQFVVPLTPFEALHWGVSAYGGRIFDAEGTLVINSESTVEWLEWLKSAQANPGFVLARNEEEAMNLFLQGKAAFMAGSSEVLIDLEQSLGRSGVGVAPLPSGPEGPSGPILKTQALVVNPQTDNLEAALDFARYTTSVSSQKILLDVGRVTPANNNLVPEEGQAAIAGLMEQATTAVAPPNRPEAGTMLGLGDIVYDKVLRQGADPETVLNDFATFIARVHALPESVDACTDTGDVILWHGLQGGEAAVLEQIVADFARVCPDIHVQVVFVSPDDLPNALAVAVESTARAEAEDSAGGTGDNEATVQPPDLMIAPHTLIDPLSDERLIQPVTDLVDGATLIPFVPEALYAFQVQDALYGLPLSFETTALYYNTETIHEPPHTFYDLFASATISTPLALDTSFKEAFWGALAFGGDLTGVREPADGGMPAGINLKRTSLVKWLDWLQAIQTRPGVFFSSDANKLKELFITGNVAYLVTSSDHLGQLRSELESDLAQGARVGVALLPPGPSGPASPFLSFEGFLFTAGVDARRTQAAVRFAEFATSGPEQALFMRDADQPPANIMAQTLAEDPAMQNLLAQVRTSVLLPPMPQTQLLLRGGDQLYRQVLEDGETPSVAYQAFEKYLEETPLSAVVVRAGDAVVACSGVGRLRVWHSWPEIDKAPGDDQAGEAESVWEQVVAAYHQVCPDTVVETAYVPVEDLVPALAEARAEGTEPDLFLVHNGQIPELVGAGVITSITGLVDNAYLDGYEPQLLEAFRLDGKLYGLPQFVDSVGLFYNTDLVSTTVTTLDELLEMATAERPVLLPMSFPDLYWGVAAFGPLPLDAGGRLVETSGLRTWLNWLRDVQEHPGVTMGSDPQALKRRFAQGDAAYLVGHSNLLPELRQELGDKVRVIPLPSGPNGPARPLLQVEGFVFSGAGNLEQLRRAIVFAHVLSDASTLALLTQAVYKAPANRRLAETVSDPALALFAGQASEHGILLPAGLSSEQEQAFYTLFEQVLAEGVAPERALEALEAAFAE